MKRPSIVETKAGYLVIGRPWESERMNIGNARKGIALGFSAAIVLIIALCASAYMELRSIEMQAASLDKDSVPGIYIIGEIQARSISIHALVERHILEQDSTKMRELVSEIEKQTAELSDSLKQYEPSIVRPSERRYYNAVSNAIPPYRDIRAAVLRLSADSKTKGQASVLLRGQLEPAYEKLQNAILQEVNDNRTMANEGAQRIQTSVDRAQFGLVFIFLIGIVLALAAGYFLIQSVTTLQEMIRRVQKLGLQVNASSTEIAATAQEQLSTATEVATTTAEIGATSNEISTTSKELVQTIKEIATVAEQTASIAANGQTGLNQMKATMQQVVEASALINTRLATLSEKAGNIGTVVTTITKVADQTNLLSLNAAIEAEKAGDYGRGFSVVATEIRRLADQTAVSTADIEQIVKEMQSAVAAGVMGMDRFSEEVHRGSDVVRQVSDELSQIIRHVQALTPNFETVSEGMQSQSQGAQQISDALSQLSEASKQTVESLRESNAAIGQLNDAARGLQDGVARFKLQK